MVTTMTLLTSTQYHCHKCPQICCVCRNLNPGFSSFMTCHQVCYKNHTTGVSRGTGMPTLPEHQSSPLDFSGLCVAQSLVLCVVFCRSLSFFLFVSDYSFACKECRNYMQRLLFQQRMIKSVTFELFQKTILVRRPYIQTLLFRVVRWLKYSLDQINTTGYGYRAKISLVKWSIQQLLEKGAGCSSFLMM